jgi:tetratricopeptide (TPR) repeat protein
MPRLALALLLLACSTLACAQPDSFANRAEAQAALSDPAPEQRARAVVWFARNGTAADDRELLPRLSDEHPGVRDLAEQGMWVIWSRSGDDAVDALMAKGIEEMQAQRYKASIATFSEVIKRKPAFAEGWNKRATARFLAGDLAKSLADCDQVMKRNPYHFGALSGYGQIYFQQKQYDKAIAYWKRALQVNPNLTGLAGNIEIAEKLLADVRKRSA